MDIYMDENEKCIMLNIFKMNNDIMHLLFCSEFFYILWQTGSP